MPTAPATPGIITPPPVGRQITQIAVPAIGENLLQTSLVIVDTLMIARYGQVPLAAAAMAGVIIWRAQMTFGCIEKGTMAMVARYAGQGDKEHAARAVAQSIILATVIGIIMSIVGFNIAGPALALMQAAPDVVKTGTPYLQIIFLASLPRMFFFVAAASLRAVGDTRSPMYITLWMNVLNVMLNFPLIYGLPAVPAIGFQGFTGLGLTGSGISTAIAILFSAVTVATVLNGPKGMFRVHPRHFRPQPAILKRLLTIAFPSFIEEILISFGFLVFYSFIGVLGTAALAAHAIASRIESLSYMAGIGFAIAAAAVVGQSLGMKNIQRAREAFRLSTKYCVVMMSVIALLLCIFAGPIVRLFSPENPAIEEMAIILLMIAAIEQPLLGIGMTLGGGLRGAGDTLTPMISSLFSILIVRVGFAWFFAFYLGYGIYGIYIATMVDWVFRAALLYYAYRLERWKTIKI